MGNFLFRKLRTFITPLLLLSLLGLASCGGNNQENPVVKDVALETYLDDKNDIIIGLSALFAIGTTNLTSITLPIIDPHDPDKVYGSIRFRPTLEPGYNEIGFTVNLTNAAGVQGMTGELPNGEPLPVAGIDPHNILELKIGKINSSIYFAFGDDFSLLGFAISIKEFDVINAYVPGANIFLGFDIKGVRGMAGLFTGNEELTSGLAFFADLSSVISNDIINDLIEGRMVTPDDFTAMKSNMAVSMANRLSFPDSKVSRRTVRKLQKAMKKLGDTTLTYE